MLRKGEQGRHIARPAACENPPGLCIGRVEEWGWVGYSGVMAGRLVRQLLLLCFSLMCVFFFSLSYHLLFSAFFFETGVYQLSCFGSNWLDLANKVSWVRTGIFALGIGLVGWVERAGGM